MFPPGFPRPCWHRVMSECGRVDLAPTKAAISIAVSRIGNFDKIFTHLTQEFNLNFRLICGIIYVSNVDKKRNDRRK